MHDCYIASGWFNENQARDLENIKSALDELGVNYFSPKDEIVAKPVNASANRIDFLCALQKLKAPPKPSSDRIEILTGSIDTGNL